MTHKNTIFKTLDNPTRLLFWKLDEFFILLIPFVLGVLFGNILLVVGALLKYPYARMKKKLSHRTIQHYIYWYLPTHICRHMGHFKNMPSSHSRELLL